MSVDYSDDEKKAVERIGRERGEEIDSNLNSHRVKRKELARGIREDPELDYEEPREIAELLYSMFEHPLKISENNEYYKISITDEERERQRERRIDELAAEFQDI